MSPGSTTRRGRATTRASSPQTTTRVRPTPRSRRASASRRSTSSTTRRPTGPASRRTRPTRRRSSGSRSSRTPPTTRRRRRSRRSHWQIKASGAQGVFLGGLICENGGKLIHDLITGDPGVKLILPGRVHPGRGDRPAVGRRGQRHVLLGRRPAELGAAGCRPGVRQGVLEGRGRRSGRPVLGLRRRRRRRWCCRRSRNSDGTRAGVNGQLFKTSTPERLSSARSRSTRTATSPQNPVTIYKAVKGQPVDLQGDRAGQEPGGVGVATAAARFGRGEGFGPPLAVSELGAPAQAGR